MRGQVYATRVSSAWFSSPSEYLTEPALIAPRIVSMRTA